MSSNGTSSPLRSPSSAGPMSPGLGQGFHATRDTRQSLDSDRSYTSSPPVHSNGANGNGLVNGQQNNDDTSSDPIEKLQRELERTREEKETLATQYRNLLAKLTTMRTTLGNKLKQDAVCYIKQIIRLISANACTRKSWTDGKCSYSSCKPKMTTSLRPWSC